jgi:hypothetical protein
MTTEDFNSLMLADHGALIIADADEHVISHRAILIREESVVEEWLAEDGTDLVKFYGITGKTLFVTDPALLIPNGSIGAKFELTSGSAWLIR